MEKTINRVYTWPKMRKDIEEKIKTCPTCQKCKRSEKIHMDYYLKKKLRLPNGTELIWTVGALKQSNRKMALIMKYMY